MLDKRQINKMIKIGMVAEVIKACEEKAFCFTGAVSSQTLLTAFDHDLETEKGKRLEVEITLLLSEYTNHSAGEIAYIDIHKFARNSLMENADVVLPLSRFTYNPEIMFRALDELVEIL